MAKLITLDYLPKDCMAAYDREVLHMNQYINDHGQIPQSTFIKEWHNRTNRDWLMIIQHIECTDQYSKYTVPSGMLRDAAALKKHIAQWGRFHPNILNPDMRDHHLLPKPARTIDNKTVKTTLWRFMMNCREFYCNCKGIDLPNDDSSRGKLNGNPNPNDLFDF